MIDKKIYNNIKKNFNLKNKQKKIDLFKEGVIDSFGLFKLIDLLENEFKIQIKLNNLSTKNLRTLDNIEKYIKKKLNS